MTDEEIAEWEAEWADYKPEGISIPEERRAELRREQELYLAELIEEVGEPTPEEVARAEAWWRSIEEHLTRATAE